MVHDAVYMAHQNGSVSKLVICDFMVIGKAFAIKSFWNHHQVVFLNSSK